MGWAGISELIDHEYALALEEEREEMGKILLVDISFHS